MEIRQSVRLPSGRFVTRVSVAMALRSVWHVLNGSKRRRDREWKQVMEKAEADRERRSAAGRKSWETRRRNAEIARALDAFDARPETQSVDEREPIIVADPNCRVCHGDGTYYEDVAGDGGMRMQVACDCCDDTENIEGVPV